MKALGYCGPLAILLAAGTLFAQELDLPWEREAPAAPAAAPAKASADAETCVNHLRMIYASKEIWAIETEQKNGTPVEPRVIASHMPEGWPRCPAGGTYTPNAIGEAPSCSVHGRLKDSISEPIPGPMDEETAALLAKAEAGDANAQCGMGHLYREGKGVQKDLSEAAAWYRRAAEQGNAWGMVFYGSACEMGKGIPRDLAEAALWYRRAADHGNALGAAFLGNMYEYGQGVEKSHATAAGWYRRALALDDKTAQDVAREGLKRISKNSEPPK